MSDVQFTCVDPLQRHAPKVTEEAGVIVGSPDNGYFTTSSETLAQELKQRYPNMLVTKHERMTNGRATRAITWTMPELPGTGWTRKQTEARAEGTVEPLEVSTDGG